MAPAYPNELISRSYFGEHLNPQPLICNLTIFAPYQCNVCANQAEPSQPYGLTIAHVLKVLP
jgi:hypothetical protein